MLPLLNISWNASFQFKSNKILSHHKSLGIQNGFACMTSYLWDMFESHSTPPSIKIRPIFAKTWVANLTLINLCWRFSYRVKLWVYLYNMKLAKPPPNHTWNSCKFQSIFVIFTANKSIDWSQLGTLELEYNLKFTI